MFKGSMVALVTPMKQDGAIDFRAMENLIDWHLESGTKAIVVVGTTGESATLNMQDHCNLIKFAVDYAAKRIPIIAGTGANSTSEALQLTKCAKEAGADACLLVTPYYNKPTQEGLYLHHKTIADAVDIPQILYNVPGRTACDMLPETIGRLAQISNIIGVKEATGDISRVEQIKAVSPEGFNLYTGDDVTGIDFVLAGGVGGISVTANVAPKQMAEAYDAALAGDAVKAQELDKPLQALHRDLFVEANPIPVKWALEQMGKIGFGIRLPLTRLSNQYHEKVKAAMQEAGVI